MSSTSVNVNARMAPSPACYSLIRSFEGYSSKPYKDVAGIATIGYGTTSYPDGRRVALKDTAVTREQAETYLEHHINQTASSVLRLVKVKLTQGQLDALTSLTYNIGIGNLAASTLLRLLNQGKYNDALIQFDSWKRAGGVVVAGLERRRDAEQELFNS